MRNRSLRWISPASPALPTGYYAGTRRAVPLAFTPTAGRDRTYRPGDHGRPDDRQIGAIIRDQLAGKTSTGVWRPDLQKSVALAWVPATVILDDNDDA
jgi:hypothetical protein